MVIFGLNAQERIRYVSKDFFNDAFETLLAISLIALYILSTIITGKASSTLYQKLSEYINAHLTFSGKNKSILLK